MQQPLVSLITPTFGRHAFLPAIADCVRAQSYQNIEWLVLDDSEEPSAELSQNGWDRLRYLHSPERLSIGQKRNQLLELATGDLIAHFDDDDFYGPDYLSKAVAFLLEKELDLVLSSGFFVAHLDQNRFGYYRTLVKKGAGYLFNKEGVGAINLSRKKIPWIHLCYGWSYLYRKTVWQQIKFAELNVFEDREFVRAAMRGFKCGTYESKALDCIHSVHQRSSSQCFPQFLIPEFVVESLSADAYRHVARLREIAAREEARGSAPEVVASGAAELT